MHIYGVFMNGIKHGHWLGLRDWERKFNCELVSCCVIYFEVSVQHISEIHSHALYELDLD